MRYIQILVIIYLLLANNSFACQCGGIVEPNWALEHSSAAFVGRICELKKGTETVYIGPEAYSIDVLVVRFCVEQSWKGVNGGSFEILSGYSSCDYNFEINSRYLVYTESDSALKGRSYANKCFPIKKVEEASEEIHVLDQLKGNSPEQ